VGVEFEDLDPVARARLERALGGGGKGRA